MKKVDSILIIEDGESKLISINSIIARLFPDATINTAGSVRSAIDAIDQSTPSIIIADMSLPTYDIKTKERGGSARPFGGIDVFDHLERYDISIPVLVVTSYEALTDGKNSLSLQDLSKKLRLEFPSCFIGAIYFDSTYLTWEKEIVERLKPFWEDCNDD